MYKVMESSGIKFLHVYRQESLEVRWVYLKTKKKHQKTGITFFNTNLQKIFKECEVFDEISQPDEQMPLVLLKKS